MKTQSRDTSPEVEKLQFDLLRRAGVAGRVQKLRSLSQFVIELSRGALSRAHPEWSERRLLAEWAAQTYGENVAGNLRRELGETER